MGALSVATAAAKPSLMAKIGDLKSLFPKKASKQAAEPVA
jgi:hypothetical protein